MTKCYNIWSDVEENKNLKKGLKIIKSAIQAHIMILKLKEEEYLVDEIQSLEKLKKTSEMLVPYFPKESDNICEDIWLDYKLYYFEDGTMYSEDISEKELLIKKLNILKKKINFVSSYLPKVKLVKGKDANGEILEEEVITEAYTEISLNGQKCILDNFYQFKKLLDQL